MGRAGPKQRQKLLKMPPKEGTPVKLHKYLIYRKLVCCQVRGLRSIALMYAIDCDLRDQTHVIATMPGWKRWNHRAS